jgi:hypothetical protein
VSRILGVEEEGRLGQSADDAAQLAKKEVNLMLKNNKGTK